MSTEQEQKIGTRVVKILCGDIIFGEAYAVPTESGQTEILIKHPYTTKNGNVMPYLMMEMSSGPGGVQLHPINVMWSIPLDEFPVAKEAYEKAEEQRMAQGIGLEMPDKPNIIV